MKLENIKSKTDYNMKKVTQSKQIHAQRLQKKKTLEQSVKHVQSY